MGYNHVFLNNEEYLQEAISLVDLYLTAVEKRGKERGEALFHQTSLADGISTFHQRVPEHTTIPMEVVRREFHLTDFQFFCLLMGYVAKASPDHRIRLSRCQGSPNVTHPTLRLSFQIYQVMEQVEVRELMETVADKALAGLLFHGALEQDLFLLEIHLSDSLISWMQGGIISPANQVCTVQHWDSLPEEPVLRRELLSQLTSQCQEILPMGGHAVFQFLGPTGTGKSFLVRHLAAALQRTLLVLDYTKFQRLEEEDRVVACSEILTDLRLHPTILYIQNYHGGMDNGGKPLTVVDAPDFLLQACNIPGLTFFGTTLPELKFQNVSVPTYSLDLDIPRGDLALNFWQEMAKNYKLSSSLEDLASTFILTPAQMMASLRNANLASSGEISKSAMNAAILSNSTVGLTHHATPIRVAYTWDDLVVEPSQKDILRHVVNKAKLRGTVLERWGFDKKLAYGRGTTVLFYGPPGTGKTMGAQVLAGEIGLALFRVDLSQVMSKYIGETEKNLSIIFKEAKNSNIILFFDEADALFSKRTEVKDARDKYANVETSYLLQKMEEHDGISILATNRVGNFDEAFKRRISYMVNFEMPNPEMRLRLWKNVFPAGAPVSQDIDLEFLAERFEFSGSMIKNIVINAAYLAAAEGEPISMKHMVHSIKSENLKAGKVTWYQDFGSYSFLLE
ncbi:MAG: ATP-binding protein [Eubacteriales bacterium]